MIKIHKSSYIADTAIIQGDVTIGENCGVYPYAIIRGDENKITIGNGSNIQDGCVIHINEKYSCIIGENVSIGHLSMVHGAVIEDACLIGIHATILNGAHIGKGSIIGANALVTSEMIVPKNSLVLGVPGKIVKQDEKFIEMILKNAEAYKRLSKDHKEGKYPTYTPE